MKHMSPDPFLPPFPGCIAVDFDGVLHEYEEWDGPAAKGGPVPGALSAVKRLRQVADERGIALVCFTTRPAGAVNVFFDEHGFQGLFHAVTDRKPAYSVLFDDRAVRVPANDAYALGAAATRAGWL